MQLRVTQYGEPILREVGAPVTEFNAELAQLTDDMVETMHTEEGIGLAAQQIGRALQLCIVDVRPPEGGEVPFGYRYDGRQPPLDLFMPLVLCNPRAAIIDPREDVYEEGCLSLSGFSTVEACFDTTELVAGQPLVYSPQRQDAAATFATSRASKCRMYFCANWSSPSSASKSMVKRGRMPMARYSGSKSPPFQ